MRERVRLGDWWGNKIPPVLGAAYLALAQHADLPGAGVMLRQIALFLVACFGIGGLGYLITDAFDVEEDRRAGKRNAWQAMRPRERMALVSLLVAAALLPWAWLPNARLAGALVLVELILFAAYAMPPVRLKERGLAGIVADASYAHALPALVAWTTFAPDAGLDVASMAVLFAWMLPMGMRHLLRHQYDDLDRDRLAGARTYAAEHGRDATMVLIAGRLLPVEAVTTIVALAWIGRTAPLLVAGFVAHAAWELHVVRARWLAPVPEWSRMTGVERHDVYGQRVLSAFVERWLAPLALLSLVWRHPATLVLVPLHLLLFGAPLRAWWQDTRALPRFGAEAS